MRSKGQQVQARKLKLTKRSIAKLRPDPGGRDVTYTDTKLPGFGLRVMPSGVKSWTLHYRNKYGQLRRITLGRETDLAPEKARGLAEERRGEIRKGKDPSAEKRAARAAETVSELCDQYLEASKGIIKASTLAMDRSRIKCHVKPLLGSRRVESLTAKDLEKFQRDVIEGKTARKPPSSPEDRKRPRGGLPRGGAIVASRTLGMLGTILQRAVRDRVIATNPARGIARPKDQARKPPFSFEAIARLGAALREMDAENETGLRAIRFLLLSGCRRMEALTLRWGSVDAKARCLRLADTKSGAQVRPIGHASLAMLGARPANAEATDPVFPGDGKAGHFVGLPRVWARVAKRAEITDVSLHGLRHWFASAAAEMNFSELTIAGLLGHKVKGVTARYATAPDNALLLAADRVSARLTDALDGRMMGEVVPLAARERAG